VGAGAVMAEEIWWIDRYLRRCKDEYHTPVPNAMPVDQRPHRINLVRAVWERLAAVQASTNAAKEAHRAGCAVRSQWVRIR
jgi:hypothetical protein